MNLLLETGLLAAWMVFFCTLPLVSARVRAHSKLFFLIGTGALVGICFFDLVPDLVELGGGSSLWVMAGVWILYSAAHLIHVGFHQHSHDVEHAPHAHHVHSAAKPGAFYVFLGSLVAHCFASGMLLALSHDISSRVAGTVFAALMLHKAYESLLFSSVLIEQERSRAWKQSMILLYSLSLPLGTAVALAFHSGMSRGVAVLMSSVAVGTLLGCLVCDFLLPSVQHLKAKWSRAGWIVAGFILTRIVMAWV